MSKFIHWLFRQNSLCRLSQGLGVEEKKKKEKKNTVDVFIKERFSMIRKFTQNSLVGLRIQACEDALFTFYSTKRIR